MIKIEKYIVDRFEGNWAVLLLRKNESMKIDVDKSQLLENVKEGDIIEVIFDSNNNIVNMKILKEETELARKRASALLQKILDENKE